MKFKYKLGSLLILAVITIQSVPIYSQSNNSPDSSGTTHWGVGIKFSNPSGITIKKYLNNKAFELIVGRPNPWKYDHYYYFKHENEFKNKGYTYAGYDYDFRPWSLQLHYLVHKDLTWMRGLSAYYGGGAQLRVASYYYNFYYFDGLIVRNGREKVKSVHAGVDGAAGLEYTFKTFPLTVYYDFNVYIEAFKNPLYLKIQSGLGARYNF